MYLHDFITVQAIKAIRYYGCCLAAFYCGFSLAISQTATSSPQALTAASELNVTSADLLNYQASQRAYAQGLTSLVVAGATVGQIKTWQQQNAPVCMALQQQAAYFSLVNAVNPSSVSSSPNIPLNATPALSALVSTNAALADARARLHNQILNALPLEVTDEQVNLAQKQEAKLFQKQQATTLQLQSQQAQALAKESAPQAIPLPPPPSTPNNASPQLITFLSAKYQLECNRINFLNQCATTNPNPASTTAALQQWIQQNAARFKQVQQLEINLGGTSSP